MNRVKLALYAEEMIRLADTGSLAEPLTGCDDDFSIADAYGIAAEVLARRERSGWRRIGRKIGFTNRTIWEQYNVYQPVFGYMYDRTVIDAGPDAAEASLSLDGLTQPLIEPEIVFKLRASPATRDPESVLDAIEWVGHGFEIVQCHFPDWRFQAADTIADGGLHGRYVLGPRFDVPRGSEADLAEALASFRVGLLRDGELAAEGGGDLVLGSPLLALGHLVELLAGLPGHPSLEAGEIVTTGTLTAALPVATGQTWSTRFEGLDMPGFSLKLV